jgi:hypothetical protein
MACGGGGVPDAFPTRQDVDGLTRAKVSTQRDGVNRMAGIVTGIVTGVVTGVVRGWGRLGAGASAVPPASVVRQPFV